MQTCLFIFQHKWKKKRLNLVEKWNKKLLGNNLHVRLCPCLRFVSGLWGNSWTYCLITDKFTNLIISYLETRAWQSLKRHKVIHYFCSYTSNKLLNDMRKICRPVKKTIVFFCFIPDNFSCIGSELHPEAAGSVELHPGSWRATSLFFFFIQVWDQFSCQSQWIRYRTAWTSIILSAAASSSTSADLKRPDSCLNSSSTCSNSNLCLNVKTITILF